MIKKTIERTGEDALEAIKQIVKTSKIDDYLLLLQLFEVDGDQLSNEQLKNYEIDCVSNLTDYKEHIKISTIATITKNRISYHIENDSLMLKEIVSDNKQHFIIEGLGVSRNTHIKVMFTVFRREYRETILEL